MGYIDHKDEILPLAKKMFDNYFKDEGGIEGLIEGLDNNNKEKFLKLCFFYYGRWWSYDQNIKNKIDGSFAFIVFVSIIEAMILEIDYKDFKSWYDSECSDKNKKVDDLWEEYIDNYGAAKKFICFFENYLCEEDKDYLLKNFTVWSSENEKIISLENKAKLLYGLRSNFIHDAKYIPICNGDISFISFPIKNKRCDLKGITMDTILNIFERGFVKYFKQKYAKNKK